MSYSFFFLSRVDLQNVSVVSLCRLVTNRSKQFCGLTLFVMENNFHRLRATGPLGRENILLTRTCEKEQKQK
jgi:hypothetical protein